MNYTSELYFMTFVGMSISWLAFNLSKCEIPCRISPRYTCEKAKGNSLPLLHNSYIARMLG